MTEDVGDLSRPAARSLLEATLRRLGYDIEPSRAGRPSNGGIVARRDREDRIILVAIDAGGRFRAEITWVVGEWPSQDVIGGVPVRVVDEVSRTVTMTGQAAGTRQMVEFIIALESAVPWAAPAAAGDAATDRSPG